LHSAALGDSGENVSTQQKPHIIGIGASAGGLEAITQLISHLKPDLPCAYVVL